MPITGAGPQAPDPGIDVIGSPLRLAARVRRSTPCGDNPAGNQLRQQFPELRDFACPVGRIGVDAILWFFAVVVRVVVSVRGISVGHERFSIGGKKNRRRAREPHWLPVGTPPARDRPGRSSRSGEINGRRQEPSSRTSRMRLSSIRPA